MQEYEKHAWPATGMQEASDIGDYDWGYLYIYTDGQLPEFKVDEQPTEREIRERWGHYLR